MKQLSPSTLPKDRYVFPFVCTSACVCVCVCVCVCIFIYLLYRLKSRHRGVGTHQRQGKKENGKTSEKSEEKEIDLGTDCETSNPIRAIEALIGGEEQNRKRERKEQLEKEGESGAEDKESERKRGIKRKK